MKASPFKNHHSLRRYCTLPAVFDLLEKRTLALTDPSRWEDKNDQFTIQTYKTNHGLKSVLAACFTGTRETFHHWKIFAPGAGGMCVVFRRELLEECLDAQPQMRYGLAKYQKLAAGEIENTTKLDLPFLKRIGYRDEQEYRVIWQSDSEKVDLVEVPIAPACIEKIILNPWLPRNLAKAVREVVQREVKRQGFSHTIKVEQSHLVESLVWKKAITTKFLPLALLDIVRTKPAAKG